MVSVSTFFTQWSWNEIIFGTHPVLSCIRVNQKWQEYQPQVNTGNEIDHNFHNYVHIIYPDESDKSASYLDILLNNWLNGRLTITLYDRRDDFAIVNFPFLCSNIPLLAASIRKSMFCVWQLFKARPTHFANSTVALMTFFAITNFHWPICWIISFIPIVGSSFHTGFDDG
jgi:hypothetical protein